ncbi:MAG: methyltransferase [Treponemataceae bacterium]|nr:methyltransferase [Treponemataceae bacterium]
MTVDIIAEKIVFGGNCIGKINGKAVFIPYAVPGEALSVEIVQSRRDYDTARIAAVATPSEFRRDPPCPLYGTCGGCNMMHIQPGRQRELRAGMLRDCFLRNGVEAPEITVIYGGELGYRSRIQLNGGGFSARGGGTIPVANCPVAEDAVNSWLASTPAAERPAGRCCIFGSSAVIAAGGTRGRSVCVAPEQRKAEAVLPEKLQKKANRIRRQYSGTIPSPAAAVAVSLLGKEVAFDVRGFFQSNMQVLEKAVPEVCRGLSGRRALDLYAGCGTFSVFLSDAFDEVTLVEHNRDALVFAEQNLAGRRHQSVGLSCAAWAESAEGQQFDAAVVDPPRGGLEDSVCAALCRADIPQLRYVSCDPATHARDAAKLAAGGFRLDELLLLDFYPNTSHIESLSKWTRR